MFQSQGKFRFVKHVLHYLSTHLPQGAVNGLPPIRRQAIFYSNGEYSSVTPLGRGFNNKNIELDWKW